MTPDSGKPELWRVGIAHHLMNVFEHGGHLFGRPDILQGHPQELLARVAVMLNGGIVDFQESQTGVIENPHGDGVTVENETILLFAFAQGGLGLLAVGHVARVDNDRGDFRVREPILADGLDITPGTVSVAKTELEPDSGVGQAQASLEGPRNGGKVVRKQELREDFSGERFGFIAKNSLDGRAVVEELSLLI